MKQPALDWVADKVVEDIIIKQHRHGGTRRGKTPQIKAKEPMARDLLIPDRTYGIGPSGGLMRGYGKPENTGLEWFKRALGRKT